MKNKLLALLLTVALAVSSMAAAIPVAAADGEAVSAPEPIEVGTDLMPLASTAADKVNVEDSNGYLHLYDRYYDYSQIRNDATERWQRVYSALAYQPEVGFAYRQDVLYFVSVKARIANNWAASTEIPKSYTADKANMYWVLDTYFAQKNITSPTYSAQSYNKRAAFTDFVDVTKITSDVTLQNTYKSQLAKHSNGFVISDGEGTSLDADKTGWYKNGSDGSYANLSTEWREFTWAFVSGEKPVVQDGKIYGALGFASDSGDFRCLPVDVDDFRVWYYDSEGNAVDIINGKTQDPVGYNFDDIENPAQSYSEFSRINQLFKATTGFQANNNRTAFQGHNAAYKIKNIKEYDYVQVSAASDNGSKGTIGYTFPDNTGLDGGVYRFTAEARLNFYDGCYISELSGDSYVPKHTAKFIPNEDNKARLEIRDNNNNGGEYEITSEWEPVSYEFTVLNGANVTLTDITASFEDDTYSENKAFNLRNVKLVKVEAFIPDEEFTASKADIVYTIEDGAFGVSSGASDAKIEMTYPDSYAEGNKYLTVTGRTNSRDGFILDLRGIVNNTEGNTYRLRFKVRASRELSNLTLNNAPSGYLGNETMVKLSEGVDAAGNYTKAAPTVFVPSYQYASNYKHGSGLYWWEFDNSEWKIVDLSFDDLKTAIKDKDNNIIGYNRFNVIHFGGSSAACQAVNIDIDDIIVYDNTDGFKKGKDNFDENTDEIIWKQDFQAQKVGELSDELTENFVPFKETWLPDSYRTQEVALEIGEDSTYITVQNVKELKYTPPRHSPIALKPGTYIIHADFSYPYFDGNRIVSGVGGSKNRDYIKENYNKFDVTAFVETTAGTSKLKTYTVGNDWSECEFRFEVEESASIKSVTFMFKDASGAEYTTVCYRNIYIDGNYPEEQGTPYTGIIMMLLLQKKAEAKADAGNTEADADRAASDKEAVYPIIDSEFKSVANGVTSRVKSEYPESFEAGNKYLRVSGRGNNRDGLILDLRRAVLDVSEAEYRLSFKVRSTSKIVDIRSTDTKAGYVTQKSVLRLGEGLYNGSYTPASPTVFTKDTINSAGFDSSQNGWYFDDNAWTTIDVSFKELKNQNVIQIGGGSLGTHCSDFDIDDVMIYVKGEAEPVYLEDFEDAECGELTTNLAYFYVPFQNGNVGKTYRLFDVALEIEEDRVYVTAKDADELKYTVKEGEMSLAAGEYTLHAGFIYPYYNVAGIEIAQTDDAKKQSYFKSNTNAFDVTAVIETDNGTLTFDTYTVRSAWNDCEFGFKLEKDTVIKSVSFKLTPAGGAKTTAVNLRGVYIDGVPAK